MKRSGDTGDLAIAGLEFEPPPPLAQAGQGRPARVSNAGTLGGRRGVARVARNVRRRGSKITKAQYNWTGEGQLRTVSLARVVRELAVGNPALHNRTRLVPVPIAIVSSASFPLSTAAKRNATHPRFQGARQATPGAKTNDGPHMRPEGEDEWII